MIVLNEHEWAEEMITSRSLGKKPYETFSRVARYYLDNNYSKKDTRNMLDSFLLQCEPTASLPKWSDTIDRAVSRALKYDAIRIDKIEISSADMDKIQCLKGRQLQRVAFTLLCLAKYWNAVNPHCDGWVNNKDSEIMRLANVNTSIKRQSQMYHTLNELGMIQFSKKIDNTSVRVCFAEDGESCMSVSDFRNLGYQYLKFTGETGFFECQNCGLIYKDKNQGRVRPRKYCSDCALEIHIKQTVNSVMNRRYRS